MTDTLFFSRRNDSIKHSFLVLLKKTVRYLLVGFWLHLVATAAFVFCVHSMQQFFKFYLAGNNLAVYFWLYGCLVGVAMVLFAQKDAFCRFQNYKRAKDLLFENGFDQRIVNVFVRSRCQRDAVKVAACDLGLRRRLKGYYAQLGYQWYHFVPDMILSRPQGLFEKKFWKNTLFVPFYKSRYFLW